MKKMYGEMERQYTEETASCRKTEILEKIFQALKEINKRTLGLELKTKPDSLIINLVIVIDWNMDSKFQMLTKSRALKKVSIKMTECNTKSRLQALKVQDWIWNLCHSMLKHKKKIQKH